MGLRRDAESRGCGETGEPEARFLGGLRGVALRVRRGGALTRERRAPAGCRTSALSFENRNASPHNKRDPCSPNQSGVQPSASAFSEATSLGGSQHRQIYARRWRARAATTRTRNNPRRRGSGVEPKNAGGSSRPLTLPRERAPMAHPVRDALARTNATVSANRQPRLRVCRAPRGCGSNNPLIAPRQPTTNSEGLPGRVADAPATHPSSLFANPRGALRVRRARLQRASNPSLKPAPTHTQRLAPLGRFANAAAINAEARRAPNPAPALRPASLARLVGLSSASSRGPPRSARSPHGYAQCLPPGGR